MRLSRHSLAYLGHCCIGERHLVVHNHRMAVAERASEKCKSAGSSNPRESYLHSGIHRSYLGVEKARNCNWAVVAAIEVDTRSLEAFLEVSAGV